MSAFPIRAGWFGWAGGSIGAKVASTAPIGGVVLTLTYARALRATNPSSAQFTATVAGVGRGVVSTTVGGAGNKVLTITLAAGNFTVGQAVAITYVPGGTPANRLAYSTGEEIAGGVTTVVAA
jgi:hypothetical protein